MYYIYISFMTLLVAMIIDAVSALKINSNSAYVFKKLIILILKSLIFLILLIPSAIRFGIGTDYNAYRLVYSKIILGDSGYEPLFRLINKIAYYFGDFQYVILICSVIFVFCTLAYISENTNSWMWSVFVLMYSTFYNMSFNAMRQCVATAIFLYSIKYIKQRKFVRYYLCILCAIGFHYVAFVYLPIYFIYKLKMNKKTISIAIIASMFIVLSSSIVKLILAKMIVKFNDYQANSQLPQFILFGLVQLIIGIIVLILLINQDGNLKNMIEIKLQLLIVVFVIFATVMPLGYRLIFLFSPIQMVLLPQLLKHEKNRALKVICAVSIVLTFFFSFHFAILYGNWHGTLPYVSVFDAFGMF